MLRKLIGGLAIAAISMVGTARAQNYPDHAITLIVPFVAGGPVDQAARLTGDALSKKLGVPVVIENKAGAGTTIATEFVYRAAPDGYTLLFAPSSSYSTAPFLYENLQYDINGFEVVSMISKIPYVVHIAKRIPANNLEEFLAWAKEQPSGVTNGNGGVGSVTHIQAALFSKQLGINIVHVPYKGSAAANTDLISGNIDMMLDSINGGRTHHDAGNTRIVGLVDNERWPDLPEIPTFKEKGFPDSVFYSWNAVVAPPKTPKEITGKLRAALGEVLASADIQESFQKGGQLVLTMSPEETAAFIKKEQELWGGVIKSEGIKLE